MKKITYVYTRGRKKNYENNNIQSRDFYYGLTNFDNNEFKTEIIEFDELLKNKKNIVYYIDRFFNKFFSLPFYMHKVISIKNFKKLISSDYIFLVNESTAFSLLPFLIILRLFKKIKINLFVMGMYSKKIRYSKLSKFHYLFIKLLVLNIDKLLFLGKEELKIAKKIHKKNEKLIYFPFCVDTEFWKSKEYKKKNQVIFVGNDGNKNFKLVKEIAINLKEYNFLIISNSIEFDNLNNYENIKVLKGELSSINITDKQLREFYEESLLSILPLINSTQPSGQSVALQSMCMEVPVLISKTIGFWDNEKFLDDVHLKFVEENNLDGWINQIRESISQHENMKKISFNAHKLVEDEFNIEKFSKNLQRLMFG